MLLNSNALFLALGNKCFMLLLLCIESLHLFLDVDLFAICSLSWPTFVTEFTRAAVRQRCDIVPT